MTMRPSLETIEALACAAALHEATASPELAREREWYRVAGQQWTTRHHVPAQDLDRVLGTVLPLEADAAGSRLRGLGVQMTWLAWSGVLHEERLLGWMFDEAPSPASVLVVLSTTRQKVMTIATRAKYVCAVQIEVVQQMPKQGRVGRA
jgi:hypothetical protein